MRPISKKVFEAIQADSEYRTCMRLRWFGDHACEGRITLEHALMYGGRQVDEKFAIISLCAYAHSVDEFQDSGILDKSKNEFIALSRASEEDFKKYPKSGWKQRLAYLVKKYAKGGGVVKRNHQLSSVS